MGIGSRNPVYAVATATSIAAFRLLQWDVRVAGAEHVPGTGPALIATNHIGYLDFVFVGYAARRAHGRRVRFVAKREVFDHPVSGPLMRAMNHIPVDRDGRARDLVRRVGDALAEGDLVGMFPEGTINRSFVPTFGRAGAARMAVQSGVPLIPGAVWGSQRILTKGRRFHPARGTVITVGLGAPVPYERGENPAAVHTRLMATIGELADRAQRRYPQRPIGDDAWWQPAHLGGAAPTTDEAERQAREEAARRRRLGAR